MDIVYRNSMARWKYKIHPDKKDKLIQIVQVFYPLETSRNKQTKIPKRME